MSKYQKKEQDRQVPQYGYRSPDRPIRPDVMNREQSRAGGNVAQFKAERERTRFRK